MTRRITNMANEIIFSRAWGSTKTAFRIATDGKLASIDKREITREEGKIQETPWETLDIFNLDDMIGISKHRGVIIPTERWADISHQMKQGTNWKQEGLI